MDDRELFVSSLHVAFGKAVVRVRGTGEELCVEAKNADRRIELTLTEKRVSKGIERIRLILPHRSSASS